MKLLILLILLILNRIVNGENLWCDCVLRQTITETESKYSDRLDVAGPNSMTFCWTETFDRVHTTYYNGIMVGFVTYKVTQRNAVGMEKQALAWVKIFDRQNETITCENYPRLTEKMWAILVSQGWYVDMDEPEPENPTCYIP